MNLVRWIFAGIVGALIGAGIWIGVEYATGHELIWLTVLIGVTTGLAVRWSGAQKRISYLRGAIACLCALSAIVSANFALAQILMATSRDDKPPMIVSGPGTPNSDDSNAGRPATSNTLTEIEAIAKHDAVVISPGNVRGVRESFNWIELVLFGLAGVIAYELGRGSGKKIPQDKTEPTDDSTSETPETEPPIT